MSSAKANLEAARVTRDNTAVLFERASELSKSGVASKNDYDNAKANADSAKAKYEQTQAAVSQADAQSRVSAAGLQQAKAQLQQAQADLNRQLLMSQEAIGGLITLAQDEQEIAARVLEPMADIVGARAVAIYNSRGALVGSYGAPDDSDPIAVAMPDGGRVCAWTTPYAPYFGSEELALLRTLGALTGLALDRARLFAREHQARVALEEANELKASFIALAAHELRTPVTTIYGFAETLDRLAERLEPERLVELRRSLANEARRLVVLVEQLLDLSRLDANAIEIVPQRFNVRARVEELLPLAAAGRAEEVEVDVPAELETTVDPHAFDRIVSNLITNALRYGEAPVLVRAERSDRHFRIAVEDRGPGVPAEFESELFERFTRSRASRERAGGTGLGLAIARSYALAHRGDLLYEPAEPRGARFQLVLPLQAEEFEAHGALWRDSRLPPAGRTLA